MRDRKDRHFTQSRHFVAASIRRQIPRGRTDRSQVIDVESEICRATLDAGADELAVVDTIGACSPEAVELLISEVAAWFGPKLPLHFNGHNDFGLARACAIAAARAGANWIQGTINGRAGRQCRHRRHNLPAREKRFPAWHFAFPAQEKRFPARHFAFPAEEKRFPARHFAFPARETRFPTRHFAFPHGKRDFPLGGIKFLLVLKAVTDRRPRRGSPECYCDGFRRGPYDALEGSHRITLPSRIDIICFGFYNEHTHLARKVRRKIPRQEEK